MNCPKCGAFIGLFSCPVCSGVDVKITDSARDVMRQLKNILKLWEDKK